MGVLEELEKNNQFPVLFIGSGISKRYLREFPSWIQLLEILWNDIGSTKNFFGRYQMIKTNFENKENELTEKELEFKTNITISKEISNEFNELVYNEELHVDGYTVQDFYEKNKNPFKEKIVSLLKEYKIKDGIDEELQTFKKALLKSQVIFTTNYDTFLEDMYNDISSYSIQKYVGQTGFFKNTEGYAEIYKIHGCATDSDSIVILPEDYERYDKNSLLISATITSLMINSPIIFLGYSLSDLNVRKYIGDFAHAANGEGVDLSKKLIVVEYKEDEQNLNEEVIFDPQLNCRFTYIKTDNYTKVYNHIRKINQGVAPSEVRKYKSLIKEIIVKSGKKGKLENVLVSPTDLEKIEKMLNEKGIIESNLVVAIGDSKVIFKPLSLLEYLNHYYNDYNLSLETAFNFLATQGASSRQPFMKFLTEDNINQSSLSADFKEKLRQRLRNQSDISKQIESINQSYKKEYKSLQEILEMNARKYVKYALIAYNINNLELAEVERFIRDELSQLLDNGENKVGTEFRRLMLIHDLKKYR